MLPSALEFMRQVALEAGATVLAESAETLDVSTVVTYADQATDVYHLTFLLNKASVKVCESKPEHLPAFCPERHINRDSTFCLSWDEDESLSVRDVATARRFYTVMLRFLVDQRRAKRSRKWPKEAWAHGGAARHQMAAERAAQELGPKFSDALAKGMLEVRIGPPVDVLRGAPLRVYIGGRFEYAVWSKTKRVANTRQPCFCSMQSKWPRKRLGSCGTHATAATTLAFSILEWREAEAQYWEQMRDEACCQTCDGCALSSRPTAETAASEAALSSID